MSHPTTEGGRVNSRPFSKIDPAIDTWMSYRNNAHYYFRPSLGNFASLLICLGAAPFALYCVFINFHIKGDHNLGRKHTVQLWEEWLTNQPILKKIFFRNLPDRTYPNGELPTRYREQFKER